MTVVQFLGGLFLVWLIPLIILMRAKKVLGTNDDTQMYFWASMYLPLLTVGFIALLFFELFDIPAFLALIIYVGTQVSILILHERELPKVIESRNERERKLAEKQRKKEEDKRKKEEILDKWKD